MAMKLLKKTTQYSIYQRGDQRFAVKDAYQRPVNGDAKAQILLAEDLIKMATPAKPAVEVSAEQQPTAAADAEASAAAE